MVSHTVVILGYKMLTSDFSSSDLFIDLVNIVLFCWQTQHKSDMGLPTLMCGARDQQRILVISSLLHRTRRTGSKSSVVSG